MTDYSKTQWEEHYTRDKSRLTYPDENLVRMLFPYLKNLPDRNGLTALDLGCGSGRHLALLKECDIAEIWGCDYSQQALDMSSYYSFAQLLNCNNNALPFQNDYFDIVVAWGSLHYTTKDITEQSYNEIFRVLKKGGRLFGTLRSTYDTFLNNGENLNNNTGKTSIPDLNEATISLFSQDELELYLSPFSKKEFGLIERTPTGKLDKRISHWYYWGEK